MDVTTQNNSVYYGANSATASAATSAHNERVDFHEVNELGRDAFLHILITQLQNQDPFQPMDDKEFVAQLAQFSSLEQMTQLNQTAEYMLDMQFHSVLAQHSNLVGQYVHWQYGDASGEGMVQAVFFDEGEIKAEMDDGTQVPVYALHRVQEAESEVDDDLGDDTNGDNVEEFSDEQQ